MYVCMYVVVDDDGNDDNVCMYDDDCVDDCVDDGDDDDDNYTDDDSDDYCDEDVWYIECLRRY
jgi:hypothetical protein